MKHQTAKTSSAQQRLWQILQGSWPALKGSLAKVYKPCIRAHCQTCASGKKHANWLLAFTARGRRRCLYVPFGAVPLLKRALANGRRIERALYAMGPTLIQEYRLANPAQTGPAVALRKPSNKKRSTKS